MRIVSLTCSNTEIVSALGCADWLVGVDSDSDYPPEVVEKLPRVGRDLDVDADKVKALNPDLVLASLTVPGHEKVLERLEKVGLPYIAPEPVTLEDVYQDIRDIGAKLGVSERAESVVAEMKSEIQFHPLTLGAPSILIEWWPKPVIVPGKQSWATDLIHAAGGRNPLAERDVKSTPLEDAEVTEIDPSAFVISWCGVKPEKYRPDVIYRNAAWENAQAIVNRQVHCISEEYLGRPSPRLVEGYKALRRVVQACTE
ncbi:MAG: helical backbone metal receptor [Pseudomonadota bacterium]